MIYLAAPFQTKERRKNAIKAKNILISRGFQVYAPWEVFIENAWDYSEADWAYLVFKNDEKAIKECDFVVMLSYGRMSSAGTNWECGYAYGIGKRVIVVEMTNKQMSLMVMNGSHSIVKGLRGLNKYDFNTFPKLKTGTSQK
jgi:nucleoside 2-deoxyribosyltransferase